MRLNPLHVSSGSRSPTFTDFMCAAHDLKSGKKKHYSFFKVLGTHLVWSVKCNITTAVCRPPLSSLSLSSVIVLG